MSSSEWQQKWKHFTKDISEFSDHLLHQLTANTANNTTSGELWLLGEYYPLIKSDPTTTSANTSVTTTTTTTTNTFSTSAIELTLSEAFTSDYKSRLYFCYRSQFPPLPSTSFTSDVGWGCMLRCGQMLLGQCLILHLLGRQWRLGQRGDDDAIWEGYLRILSYFLDQPQSQFGIHAFTQRGLVYDVPVGNWYGPRTIANVIRDCVNSSGLGVKCQIAQEAIIYNDTLLETVNNWQHTLLLLIPVRLGVDKINQEYHKALLELFKWKSLCGVAGGQPRAAYYFLGVDGGDLIYLDPHIVRPAIDYCGFAGDADGDANAMLERILTYHCSVVKKTSITALDPSLLLGFYLKDEQEYATFKQLSQQLFSKGAIYTFEDTTPTWMNESINTGETDEDDYDLV
jgi:cysteine protease ATG4